MNRIFLSLRIIFLKKYDGGYLFNYVFAVKEGDSSGFRVIVDLFYPGYSQYATSCAIKSDLSFESSFTGSGIFPASDGVLSLVSTGMSPDSILVDIQTKGTGNKSLMDDGTYKEVQARDDVENSFLTIVSQLIRDQPATLSQSQYNTIKSLFKGSTTSALKIVRPSESLVSDSNIFNINDLLVIYNHDTGSINVLISGSGNFANMGFIDLYINIYSNLSVEYVSSFINIVAGDDSEITLVRGYNST